MGVVGGVYNMKKFYIIVEYDLRNNGYLQCAVDGIVFEDKKTAEEYMNSKPNYFRMSIEELTLYYEKSEVIPPPPKAPPLRTISETFFQNKDYPTDGKRCELCGKLVHSNSKVQTVCDKCASEYKF